MASLLPGFEYDIFISYRQKDNKYDGWVSEFVDNLKKELEGTFKEEINLYFDINPHTGLLETHDVDASLKEKLKCLVFIPVISRTYCDPKSFAWENEFLRFISQASSDNFGLKVKLPGGNIASRVLPVQIYELDPEDRKLVEGELGGYLRAIEFIYKEPGVNRPLRANEEYPDSNLSRITYRNQINKVANSIKDIITGMKNPESEPVSKKTFAKPVISKVPAFRKPGLIIATIALIISLVAGIAFLPKLFRHKPESDKSIAVLPFKLMSNEQDKQYLADGMMDAITLYLSRVNGLRVMSRTSVEQYRGTTKTTKVIGKELGVSYLLEGSFQKYGDNVRLIVQLINADKESHVWAGEYNNNWNDIFTIQSEVARRIANELHTVITPEQIQMLNSKPTTNLVAYNLFRKGREEYLKFSYNKREEIHFNNAVSLYKQALAEDSTLAEAYSGLAIAKIDKYWYTIYARRSYSKEDAAFAHDSVLTLIEKALKYNPRLEEAYYVRGWCSGNIEEALADYQKALEINPNYSLSYLAISDIMFNDRNQSVDAIKYKLKAIEIERGPILPIILSSLGTWYELLGFNDNAIDIYNQILRITGDSLQYFIRMSGPYFAKRDWKTSSSYAERIIKLDNENFWAYGQLALINIYLGNDDKISFYTGKMKDLVKKNVFSFNDFYLPDGYLNWKKGDKEQAVREFQQVEKFYLQLINSNLSSGQTNNFYYYTIAKIHALQGDKNKAFEYLEKIDTDILKNSWFIEDMELSPFFESVRHEVRFKTIYDLMKSKWQKEHDLVGVWLSENNLLKESSL